ncbi:MAG: aldo/keto reductase [Christensenellales bacterium]|jgi:predicted oxidoreductase
MNRIYMADGELTASEISLGCYRNSCLSINELDRLISAALEEGIDFFDHADVYGGGQSEEKFGTVLKMKPGVREKIIIQTKCGIRQGYYDSSKEHILSAVDGSLKRLKTDRIDILLLHRPDALIEPQEVGEAFLRLYASGKVKYFGVSNFNPMQIKLLSQHLKQKIILNQLQLSLTNTGMIDVGINVNLKNTRAADRDGSVLDYCRLNGITLQAWSPFQYGFMEGVFLDNDDYPELNSKINEIAILKGVPKAAVAVAWILRHPAKIQVIVGTTNADRLKDICRASEVTLSRQEWYALYQSAGNELP